MDEIFNEKFEKIRNTLLEIEVAKSSIEYYINASKNFKEIVENSDQFYNSYFFSNKMLFINLAILLDQRDEFYSFQRLFNYIESNRKKLNLIGKAEFELVEIQKYDFGKIINSKFYEDVKLYRDKKLAHHDKSFKSINLEIRYLEVFDQVKNLQNIYNQLNFIIFKSTLEFEKVIREPHEFINLFKYKKLVNLIYSELKQNPGDKLLNEMRNIILGRL